MNTLCYNLRKPVCGIAVLHSALLAACMATLALSVAHAQQTFPNMPVMDVDDPPFELNATASSDLPVSFISSDSTIAKVSGSTLTLLKPGDIVITAGQTGNEQFAPASSVQRSLTVTGPPDVYLLVPYDGERYIETKKRVTAKAVHGASTYTIQISLSPDFSNNVRTRTGGRQQTFDSLFYNAAYYARVKTDLDPRFGKSTAFHTIGAEAHHYVVYPPDGAYDMNTSVTVTSHGILGASYYLIQLSEAPVVRPVLFEAVTKTGSARFTGLKYGTTYYTLVSTSFDVRGRVTSFTTRDASQRTFLQSPQHNAVNVNYAANLVSKSITGATIYHFEISTNSDFSPPIMFRQSTASNLPVMLSYDQTYYVRVRTDIDSGEGKTTSFTTGNPVSLSYMINPKDGGVGVPTTVTVSVNFVSGTSLYTLELNTASDFSGQSLVQTKGSRTFHFTGLAPGTTYYARASTDLVPGQWGPARSFTTADPSSSARVAADWQGEDIEEGVFTEFAADVYPNPFHDKLSVYVEASAQHPLTLGLIDVTGREVQRTADFTNRLVEIENALPNGVYFLRVRTAIHSKMIRVVKTE